jgi:hypothetical protein
MGLEGEWAPIYLVPGTDWVWAGLLRSAQRHRPCPPLAPGPLGDAMPSSRGGTPSRPLVAALFGVACSASASQPPHLRARDRCPKPWPRHLAANPPALPEDSPPSLKTTGGGPLQGGRSTFVQASWPCTPPSTPPAPRPPSCASRAPIRLDLDPLRVLINREHATSACAHASASLSTGCCGGSRLPQDQGGASLEWPAPPRSVVIVQASWPCTRPRPCGVAAPQPPRPWTRNQAPARGDGPR